MTSKLSTLPLSLTLVVLSLLPSVVFGQDEIRAQGWAVSVGMFDTAGNPIDELDFNIEQPFEGTVEYRFRPFFLNKNVPIIPAFGVSATTGGSLWIFSSFRYDWEFAPHWFLTPSTGVTLYDRGDDGKDLGGTVEFRSGIEISRQLPDGSRVGLLFYHLSNANLYDINPGNNSFVLTWSFGRL